MCRSGAALKAMFCLIVSIWGCSKSYILFDWSIWNCSKSCVLFDCVNLELLYKLCSVSLCQSEAALKAVFCFIVSIWGCSKSYVLFDCVNLEDNNNNYRNQCFKIYDLEKFWSQVALEGG